MNYAHKSRKIALLAMKVVTISVLFCALLSCSSTAGGQAVPVNPAYDNGGDGNERTDIAEKQQEWDAGRRDQEFIVVYAEMLIQDEDYRQARRVLLTGLTEFPNDEELAALHTQAIRQDDRLTSNQTIEFYDPAGFKAHGLYNRAGHRGFIFEDSQDSAHRLIFKPSHTGWQDQWRSEVAAWRFCELLICHFDVFRVEPAVITEEFLAEIKGDTHQFSTLAEQANWETIEIDGGQAQAVRGSLEYVPRKKSKPFPLELRLLWQNWLLIDTGFDAFDEPIGNNLSPIQDFVDDIFYYELVVALGDALTGDIARQISNLLTFDYLTNNWERFFVRSKDHGTNNPVIGGALVSRHNGEAFQPTSSRRVQGRFEWTMRFSRSTVASIRALERELVFEILFPEASDTEQRRLKVMWTQRQNMLDRVDKLIALHGEEDILFFP